MYPIRAPSFLQRRTPSRQNTVLNAGSIDGIALVGFFSGNVEELFISQLDSGVLNAFDSTEGTSRQALNSIFRC